MQAEESFALLKPHTSKIIIAGTRSPTINLLGKYSLVLVIGSLKIPVVLNHLIYPLLAVGAMRKATLGIRPLQFLHQF